MTWPLPILSEASQRMTTDGLPLPLITLPLAADGPVHPFGGFPVLGGVDVLDQVARDLYRHGVGGEQPSLRQVLAGVDPVELPGVVVCFAEVLGAFLSVLGPDHLQPAVVVELKCPEDASWKGGDGECRDGLVAAEQFEPLAEIFAPDERGGSIDAAAVIGPASMLLQPLQPVKQDGVGAGKVVG